MPDDNGRSEARLAAKQAIQCDFHRHIFTPDPDILTYCRTGGKHVRGRWVVDLLLGKS
jgi:hypothetical protein